MSDPQGEGAFNRLPTVVWLMVLPIIAMELALGLGGLTGADGAVGWRLQAVQTFAYSPEAMRWMLATGNWGLEPGARVVTYAFVHPATLPALFAVAFVLALGKWVGEVFSAPAVLAIFLASAIGGALAFTLAGGARVLIGAFPAAYGLIGAFTFLLWVRLSAQGGPQGRAFSLIAMLMGVQLLFAVFIDTGMEWVADLGGFATGFGLSFLLVPGGPRRVLALIRRR
jgi:membrane associated rhomboid family serine protease